MPVSPRETVLCRYSHDPLDRQTDCILLTLPAIQRFYCRSRLATEIQGALRTNVFQHDDQLLAQQRQQDGKVDTTLLATDQKRTVLGAHGLTGSHFLAYTPYGHRPPENGLLSLLGFNGERPDPVTGHYHLGNGYRQFNPVLMRFNSPDSWSPFGEGGLNAYGYCAGDPINHVDPVGHAPQFLLAIRSFFKSRRRVLPVESVLPPPTPQTIILASANNPPRSPSSQVMRPSYRNPLANGEMNTQITATSTPALVNIDGTISRANYPPSYLQRPDSPPPLYRSSPLYRAPNTPGELPPAYEHAAQDPLFDIRVTTRGWFLKKPQLSVRIIRN